MYRREDLVRSLLRFQPRYDVLAEPMTGVGGEKSEIEWDEVTTGAF
jgi:hypothetical protein